MSDDLEKVIMRMSEDIAEIKTYIPSMDKVTLKRYCEIRTESGSPLTVHGLRKWFKKGCPKEGDRHVSRKAVDKWAAENNTHGNSKKK
jgi:hypothetical protein